MSLVSPSLKSRSGGGHESSSWERSKYYSTIVQVIDGHNLRSFANWGNSKDSELVPTSELSKMIPCRRSFIDNLWLKANMDPLTFTKNYSSEIRRASYCRKELPPKTSAQSDALMHLSYLRVTRVRVRCSSKCPWKNNWNKFFRDRKNAPLLFQECKLVGRKSDAKIVAASTTN